MRQRKSEGRRGRQISEEKLKYREREEERKDVNDVKEKTCECLLCWQLLVFDNALFFIVQHVFSELSNINHLVYECIVLY